MMSQVSMGEEGSNDVDLYKWSRDWYTVTCCSMGCLAS